MNVVEIADSLRLSQGLLSTPRGDYMHDVRMSGGTVAASKRSLMAV
jgi:hypothetical protein